MFKKIPHYPNYSISKQGLVRNDKTGNFMTWIDNGKGYQSVKIYNEQKPTGRMCLVHRLVLSTYLPQEGNLDVNHIDGEKTNNNLSNLEWVTKSENTRHAHLTGLFKNKLTIDQVKEIKAIADKTQQEVADKYGVNRSVIGKIWSGYLYGYV